MLSQVLQRQLWGWSLTARSYVENYITQKLQTIIGCKLIRLINAAQDDDDVVSFYKHTNKQTNTFSQSFKFRGGSKSIIKQVNFYNQESQWMKENKKSCRENMRGPGQIYRTGGQDLWAGRVLQDQWVSGGCNTCVFIKGKKQIGRAALGSTEPGQNISKSTLSDRSLWQRPKSWRKSLPHLVIVQKRWVNLWSCKGIKTEEDGWMKSWMSQPLPQKGNLEMGQEFLSIFATIVHESMNVSSSWRILSLCRNRTHSGCHE